jgi:Skp family chaperone for outer membrane proteins
VIDTAKKEFKGHVEEMEKQREEDIQGWAAAFEEDSFNPRAFSQHQSAAKGKKVQESLESTEHFTNPFYDEKNPFLNQSYNN